MNYYVKVPSSPVLVTLMMKAISSSETSVLTEPHRNIPACSIVPQSLRYGEPPFKIIIDLKLYDIRNKENDACTSCMIDILKYNEL
jgi:hypothetical protein